MRVPGQVNLRASAAAAGRGPGVGRLVALALALSTVPAQAEPPGRFVVAASTRSEEQSPRRLFNAGLRAEEGGNLALACQLFMAARLAARESVADMLYARGAALRLVRVLAGRDDDAASAAAVLIEDAGESSDLGPLVRTLLRRVRGERPAVEMLSATLVATRWARATDSVLLELELDSGEQRVVEADAPVSPLSAGLRVKVLVRKTHGRASSSWRLVAMGREHADGWQLIRVSDLPGTPMDVDGAWASRARAEGEPPDSAPRPRATRAPRARAGGGG